MKSCSYCGAALYQLSGDVLIRHAHDRHMLRAPAAWSFYVRTLEQYRARGARSIVVVNVDSGLRWYVTFADFDRYSIARVNRGGYGGQVALPLSRWRCERATGAPVQQRQAAADRRQLRLMD